MPRQLPRAAILLFAACASQAGAFQTDPQAAAYLESDRFEAAFARELMAQTEAYYGKMTCERLPEARIRKFEPLADIGYASGAATGPFRFVAAYKQCQRQFWITGVAQASSSGVALRFWHTGFSALSTPAFSQAYPAISAAAAAELGPCPAQNVRLLNAQVLSAPGNSATWTEKWTFVGCGRQTSPAYGFSSAEDGSLSFKKLP